MTKSVRFLIALVIVLVAIILSRGNNLPRTVSETPIPVLTAVAVSTDEPTRQRNLVLVEFFSGL